MMPGMTNWPRTLNTSADFGMTTWAEGATALMRLRSTRIVASGMTSSPRIVITVAPTRAIEPVGLSVGAENPTASPDVSGLSCTLSGAPSTNLNVFVRSREYRSGPRDQYNFRLSEDQFR